MAKGCDYAWERPDPKALAAAGYTFACRYLSYDTKGKNLTAGEAAALHGAGLSIVLNWEYNPQAALAGYAAGVNDGTEAWRQARALGAPESTPIYFSLDWDVQSGELDAVRSYLQGIASVMPWECVGVYGGLRAVSYAASLRPQPWLWQTYAWSGGQWSPAARIRQVRNGVSFGGLSIDLDESMSTAYGQWDPPTTTGGTMSQPNYPEIERNSHNADWGVNALLKLEDPGQGFIQMDGSVFSIPNNLARALKRIEGKLDQLLARPTATGQFTLSGSATLSGGGTITPSV